MSATENRPTDGNKELTLDKWDLRRIAEFKELSRLCGMYGAWPCQEIRAEMDRLSDTVSDIVALWPSEALADPAPNPLNHTPNALICPICGTVLTSDPMHDTTHTNAAPRP